MVKNKDHPWTFSHLLSRYTQSCRKLTYSTRKIIQLPILFFDQITSCNLLSFFREIHGKEKLPSVIDLLLIGSSPKIPVHLSIMYFTAALYKSWTLVTPFATASLNAASTFFRETWNLFASPRILSHVFNQEENILWKLVNKLLFRM